MSRTTLVLLPGLDGTGRFFSRLEHRLAGRVPVLTIGYPQDANLGYRALTDLVLSRIEGEDVVVLGESFSGPIAVMVAAASPQCVKGVILSSTFLKLPWPAWLVRASAAFEPAGLARALLGPILRGRDDDPELSAQIADVMAAFPADVRAARLRAVAAMDAREIFKTIACPVLALHGRNDWLVPRSSIVTAVARKPGAVLKLLDGQHMLLQTNTVAAATVIEAFMNSIDGQA